MTDRVVEHVGSVGAAQLVVGCRAPALRRGREVVDVQRRCDVDERVLVAPEQGLAATHGRREHGDVFRGQVARGQGLARADVAEREPGSADETSRPLLRHRDPVREPGRSAERGILRPRAGGVPLAQGTERFSLEALLGSEDVDEPNRLGGVRPSRTVLAAQAFEAAEHLGERVGAFLRDKHTFVVYRMESADARVYRKISRNLAFRRLA